MSATPTVEEDDAKEPGKVEFLGEMFELKAGGVTGYKLARFALAVRRAEENNILTNVSAPLEFVEASLAEHERGRFHALADAKDAELDDIQHVIDQLWGTKTDRPTERPSDSSGGPQNTDPSSTSNAEGKVSGRFDGRPDLRKHLQMVKDAGKAS